MVFMVLGDELGVDSVVEGDLGGIFWVYLGDGVCYGLGIIC